MNFTMPKKPLSKFYVKKVLNKELFLNFYKKYKKYKTWFFRKILTLTD